MRHAKPKRGLVRVAAGAGPSTLVPAALVPAAVTVEAMVAAPMAPSASKANENAGAITIVGIPAVAAAITPPPVAMTEIPIVHRLSSGRLIAQEVLSGGKRSCKCRVSEQQSRRRQGR